LFYREGINATGVERLASRASVSKRTLYQHFPSKAAVIEAYLGSLQERYTDAIKSRLDAAGTTPRERLLAVFDSPSQEGEPLRGCPFHNAAVEAAGGMPEVEHIVQRYKQSFIELLADLADRVGASDPMLLASQLAVLFEGAAALATSLNDSTPWVQAKAAAHTLIDEAVSR
jgi:AcrR family transcriptional regulator